MSGPPYRMMALVSSEKRRPSTSLGVMMKNWEAEDMSRRISKTARSLNSSIPWLISSTRRKGAIAICWRASRKRAVAIDFSPPLCLVLSRRASSSPSLNLTMICSSHDPSPSTDSLILPSKPSLPNILENSVLMGVINSYILFISRCFSASI
eukprot:Pompholyxophrys_punicea_v1_NODE_1_length_14747_cov_12.267901.p8 type:complete len:152 gc:universal NODE_1_length_14747_cov_12.267901:9394-8939(-)